MKKLVILGTAHGSNVPGKCSPDKRFYEYRYSREICARIKARLNALGVNCVIDWAADIVPLPQVNELSKRVSIVNQLCDKYGASNVLYISVHNNAAGSDGKWHNASGFCPFIYTKGSSSSRRMAALLYDEAKRLNLCGNRAAPKDGVWTANFYVVQKTHCPAVLTECLFQDNQAEVDFLLSEEGKESITELHVEAIRKYLNL